MSATIVANLSAMFGSEAPCYVSASQAELGPAAAEITWRNAMTIARQRSQWLLSEEAEAATAAGDWAVSTGAWTREEVDAWSDDECIALLVQNIAGELRMLGSDERSLEECVEHYRGHDWDASGDYPMGHYTIVGPERTGRGAEVHCEYYTGH